MLLLSTRLRKAKSIVTMATLWLVLMMASLVPISHAKIKDGTGCFARYIAYGDLCYSDTSSHPRPGATIQYVITVGGLRHEKICCKALKCSRRYCSMKYIGCGRNTWSSADLPWDGDDRQTPRLQCTTYLRRFGVNFSFKTIH